jgi:hypothetical protein
MRVYIAGPYTQGEQVEHVRAAVLAGIDIIRAGHVPFIPHCYHFADMIHPLPYETWMTVDLSWLAACDCLVRLPGASPGADREVERATQLGMPVYFGLATWLYEHQAPQVAVEQTLRDILEV